MRATVNREATHRPFRVQKAAQSKGSDASLLTEPHTHQALRLRLSLSHGNLWDHVGVTSILQWRRSRLGVGGSALGGQCEVRHWIQTVSKFCLPLWVIRG